MAEPDLSKYGLRPEKVQYSKQNDEPDLSAYGLSSKRVNSSNADEFIDNQLPVQSTGNPRDILKGQFGQLKQSMENLGSQSRQAGLGFAESMANLPGEISNIFLSKENRIQPFQFGEKTPAHQAGALVGNLAGFGVPRALLKVAHSLPIIKNALHEAMPWLGEKGLMNSLAKIGGSGAEAALYGAKEERKAGGNPGEGAALGGLAGAGIQSMVPFLGAANPLAALAAKGAIGGIIGAQMGNPYIGAATGAVLPLRQLMGIEGRNAIAHDMLNGINPEKALKSSMAANALNMPISIGQASGNPFIAAKEGKLGAGSGASAQALYEQQLNQQSKANRAIVGMLQDVYKPSSQARAKESALYEMANKMNLSPKFIEKITEDNAILKHAFDTVGARPAWRDHPKNNYKFLHEVKRYLQFKQKKLYENNQASEAVEIGHTLNPFKAFLEKVNPVYAEANLAAAPRLARESVQSRLKTHLEDTTPKTIYNRLIKNPENYKSILHELKPYPDALEKFKNMKTAFKEIGNLDSVSNASFRAKSNLDEFRNGASFLMDKIKGLSGEKANIKRIKYTFDTKKWMEDLPKLIQQGKAREAQQQMLSEIGRLGTAYGLSKNQIKQVQYSLTNDLKDE